MVGSSSPCAGGSSSTGSSSTGVWGSSSIAGSSSPCAGGSSSMAGSSSVGVGGSSSVGSSSTRGGVVAVEFNFAIVGMGVAGAGGRVVGTMMFGDCAGCRGASWAAPEVGVLVGGSGLRAVGIASKSGVAVDNAVPVGHCAGAPVETAGAASCGDGVSAGALVGRIVGDGGASVGVADGVNGSEGVMLPLVRSSRSTAVSRAASSDGCASAGTWAASDCSTLMCRWSVSATTGSTNGSAASSAIAT